MGEPTCATCAHIGREYWDNGFTHSHRCGKEAVRRAEGMPKHADFLDHFRAFFDASAEQKACRHYVERPIADAATLAHLKAMHDGGGQAEFKFFSEDNRLAEKLSGMFWQQAQYTKGRDGYRVYRILPVGKAEFARTTGATNG